MEFAMKKTAESDLTSFSKRYLSALRKHIDETAQTDHSANRLGRKALLMGLKTLDLARIHEKALIVLVPLSRSGRNEGQDAHRGGRFLHGDTRPYRKDP